MNLLSLTVIIIVLIIVLAIIILAIKNYYNVIKNLQFVISLPGVSILLSVVHMMQIACNYKELLNYIITLAKKYESPIRLMLGTEMYVLLTKPEDIKLVLTNTHGNYKASVTKMWQFFLGNGIIRISGAPHRIRRKLMQPLFNHKNLSGYETFLNYYSDYCADVLEKKDNGCIFDIKPYIARYTLDIFLKVFAGMEATAQKNDYDELLRCQFRLLKTGYKRSLKPWNLDWKILRWNKNTRQAYSDLKILQHFINNISRKIMERNTSEDNIDVSKKPKLFFIDKLFDTINDKSTEVTNQDFIDDICNLYVAFQNTITELACFVLLMLAIHPTVQKKLREEILTFKNGKIEAASILKMKYLRMVIQETLRLFPIVPFLARQLTGDIKLESCTLPEKCYVLIPIIVMHRDPTYWQNVKEFNPERFALENTSHYRYAYIPFGAGMKDCIGQSFAIPIVGMVIIKLLRRFHLATTIKNIKDINITNDILLRTRDGFNLSITRL